MSLLNSPHSADFEEHGPGTSQLNSALVRYGLALACWAVAFLVTWYFWKVLSEYPLPLFLVAVGASAWFAGLFPGLGAAVLSTLGFHYLAHERTFSTLDWGDALAFGTFLFTVGAITYLNRRRLRAERRTLDAQRELAGASNELSDQRAEMARFQEFSVRLSSGLELGPLINEVLSAINNLCRTNRGMVLLHDSTRNEFYPAAWQGFSEEQSRQFWQQASRELRSFAGAVPVSVEDTEGQNFSTILLQAARAAGFRALHAIPVLTRNGDVLGSLISFFAVPGRPSEREMRLLELYARHASNAIENARLYGHSVESMHVEQRRAVLLRSLAKASLRINAALNLDSLLQAITDEAREMVSAHQAFMSLAPGGDWSRMITCVSLSEKYASNPKDFQGNGPAMIFLAGRLQQSSRSSERSGLPNWSVIKPGSDQQLPSWLAAPLKSGDGRNYGLIQAVEKADGDFTEEDKSALTQLAQMAIVAIENVRLYREAQEQIRERDRTQEALERSKEALDLAHQASGIGVWEWNLQSGELSWSKEISALHGLAPEKFDGRYATWLASVHPEDRQQVNSAVTGAISEGTGYQVQYRNVHPDGSTHWMEARGQVYYAAGHPLRMLGVAMDVTARKQAEEALRASEKLAATGRLAASIAHEINNPLASVTNILYLLSKNATMDREGRRFVALAESELARVTHITRQTLAFYRESAKPSSLNLAQILDEVLTLYARNISERLITVERRYDFTDSISGFAGELRQVVSNLVLNAIEAVPVEGNIRIHLYRTRDLHREEGDGVRLVIADNGPGIPRELRNRIFEPFFSTKAEKGTGLGLWVSQGIIQKHGGRIRIRSSVRPEQSGTVFSVFLPTNHFAKEPAADDKMEAVA
ncbi:MAG: PAS domain-containing protein [Acidobacteriales bacterium]|nr:PAS domain-containing protein [Terriglobales bacterium]